MLFLTVPTAGTRNELLQALLAESGLPAERVIVIATQPNIDLPAGCTVIEDFGPVNIQRWWLKGIEEAVARGALAVAVSNDDVSIDTNTLPHLLYALRSTGAAIASPARVDKKPGLHRGRLLPYSPVMWGSLWLLDPSSGLRPNPQYRWWYGDNDLDIRARRDYSGVVSVPAYFEHRNSGEATGTSSHLQELAAGDRQKFESDYRRLVWMSHKVRVVRNRSHRILRPFSSSHTDSSLQDR